MPALLTVASTMMCPHGGTVAAIPSQTRAAAGAPIVLGSDTFLVAGCPFNISGVPNPCISVQWLVTATRVQAGGGVRAQRGQCRPVPGRHAGSARCGAYRPDATQSRRSMMPVPHNPAPWRPR